MVGRTDQVVLGTLAVGNDIMDEVLIPDWEFQADLGSPGTCDSTGTVKQLR